MPRDICWCNGLFQCSCQKNLCKKRLQKTIFQFRYPSRYGLETMMIKICIPHAGNVNADFFRGISYWITYSMKNVSLED